MEVELYPDKLFNIRILFIVLYEGKVKFKLNAKVSVFEFYPTYVRSRVYVT